MTDGGGEPDRSWLTELMSNHDVPGLSVALVEDMQVGWARAYGVKIADGEEPVTAETLFQACSISKVVTALGVLRLAHDGVLDLDSDVNAYLTSWNVPNGFRPTRISLRQLLGHTAGTSVHGFPGYPRGSALPTTIEVLDGKPPANTPPVRVEGNPGARFCYSGGGTTIIQQVLVDVLKLPFEWLMQELVLDPLGMRRSTFEQPLPEARWPEAASGHDAGGTPVLGGWRIYPEMAAAGLWTTPPDLARVVIEVQRACSGRSTAFLTKRMAEAMLIPQADGPVGMGPWIHQGSDAAFFHGGDNAGFKGLLLGFAEGGSGVVLMTNGDRGGELFRGVLRRIGDAHGWSGAAIAHATE